MTPATLLIELAEKMGLIASAAVLAVLFPPLRKRLLRHGRRSDKLAALALGLGLSCWGSFLGLSVLGTDINVRAIGIFIAALLGGFKAGTAAGIGAGLFSGWLSGHEIWAWVLLASTAEGAMAGYVSKYHDYLWSGFRLIPTTFAIQLIGLLLVGVGLTVGGDLDTFLPAWPAHAFKLAVNTAGVALFVAVTRLIIGREQAEVALIAAQRDADLAKLETLRRQLEPHFLFNALNTIRALIRISPEQARERVADLADLYRYVLSHPSDATIEQEVAHALAYLHIEQSRLGNARLHLSANVQSEVADIHIPALTLQPLAENAVRHGVGRHERGSISIKAQRVNDQDGVELCVEQSHEGLAQPSQQGHGVGLENLRKRMRHRFGERARLDLDVFEGGSRATLRIPDTTAATRPIDDIT